MVRRIQECLILLCCGCGVLHAAAPSRSWLDVPFVKQAKSGCGAASIAMVIEYWQRRQGKSTDEGLDAAQIQRALYSEAAHGIYASDIKSFFERHGFAAFAFHGEWSDVKQHLEKGRPLIVALKPHSGDLHYVVIVGLDPKQRLVLVNDPAERKLLGRNQSDFERDWKGAGYWTLLAVPREGGPSAP